MENPVEHEDPSAWGDVRDDDGQRERAQDSRPLVPSSLRLLICKKLLLVLLYKIVAQNVLSLLLGECPLLKQS